MSAETFTLDNDEMRFLTPEQTPRSFERQPSSKEIDAALDSLRVKIDEIAPEILERMDSELGKQGTNKDTEGDGVLDTIRTDGK